MSRGRVLYIAEPIDQSNHGPWKESVQRMAKVAADRGWLPYRPAGAWRVSPETSVGPEIEAINRAVIYNSRAVAAFIPKGVATIGVPREVEWAAANGTPVLAVTDLNGSWALADVDRIEFDDVPSFGQWLTIVESMNSSGIGVPYLVGEGGSLPTRHNAGDAGFDLFVSETTTIQPGEFRDVPCALNVALPLGVYARITGRSSTLRHRNLLVAEGIIDNGYRGPLYSGVFNLGDDPHTVEAGDRIAQLILHKNISAEYTSVSVSPEYFAGIPGDSRGQSGFGSTGA